MNIGQVLERAHNWGIEVCIHSNTMQFLNHRGPTSQMMGSLKTRNWYGSAWAAEEDLVHYVSGLKAEVADWCLCAAMHGPVPPTSSHGNLRYSTRKPGV